VTVRAVAAVGVGAKASVLVTTLAAVSDTPTDDDAASQALSTGAVIGAVLGVVLGLILVGLIVSPAAVHLMTETEIVRLCCRLSLWFGTSARMSTWLATLHRQPMSGRYPWGV
jgi:hypothetical protein